MDYDNDGLKKISDMLKNNTTLKILNLEGTIIEVNL